MVRSPELLVGCGVVAYGETTRAYSGLVHIGERGKVKDWYAKNHLVMFGEYIPIVQWIPVVRDWVPHRRSDSRPVALAPSILRSREKPRSRRIFVLRPQSSASRSITSDKLRDSPGIPEAIVTVTNDAWFDDSSVVQHHKRCAQLVAVACRRPILSAANNGPTCWIDSREGS